MSNAGEAGETCQVPRLKEKIAEIEALRLASKNGLA